MTEFCVLSAKTDAYKLDIDTELKKAKGTEKSVIKRNLMFENYKDPLFNDKIILRSQKRLRSDHNRVYTEEVNKISLISNDDKRIQTYDKITTYPYGTNIFKICENEMLLKNEFNDGLNNKAQVPKNELHELLNQSRALRNDSQVTRIEAQTIRNNYQLIRDELHELINEAYVIKNNSQALRNKEQIPKNKAQIPKN